MSDELPRKVIDQIHAAGLPKGGKHPFRPQIGFNRNGERIIQKRAVEQGPKAGKKGFVDEQGHIWIRDRAHAGLPDHWDVQIDEGESYFRVDLNGEPIV